MAEEKTDARPARRIDNVGGIREGETVEFTGPNFQTFYGRCIALKFREHACDYACVILQNVDGEKQIFGTGGSLGNTWTCNYGGQWFAHNFGVRP